MKLTINEKNKRKDKVQYSTGATLEAQASVIKKNYRYWSVGLSISKDEAMDDNAIRATIKKNLVIRKEIGLLGAYIVTVNGKLYDIYILGDMVKNLHQKTVGAVLKEGHKAYNAPKKVKMAIAVGRERALAFRVRNMGGV